MANLILLIAIILAGMSYTSFTARDAIAAELGDDSLFVNSRTLPISESNGLCGGWAGSNLAFGKICIGHTRLACATAASVPDSEVR